MDGFRLHLIDTPSLLDQVRSHSPARSNGLPQQRPTLAMRGLAALPAAPLNPLLSNPRHPTPNQDAVSEERLEQIAAVCEGRAIDAVLFLERLDQYSGGPRGPGWFCRLRHEDAEPRAAPGPWRPSTPLLACARARSWPPGAAHV